MSDFGSYKHVKTRKPHKCIYCGRVIPVGLKARIFKGMWEGNWQNWYACGFCEKNVEPEYAETSEGINGDEFSEWFWDSEHFHCNKCENKHGRHCNNWDWIDLTHIKVSCGDCENERIVEIPIKGV